MLLYEYVERMRGGERKNGFLARKSFSKIHILGSQLNHWDKKFLEDDFLDLGAKRGKENQQKMGKDSSVQSSMDILKQFLKKYVKVLLSVHNETKQFVKHLFECEMETFSIHGTFSLHTPLAECRHLRNTQLQKVHLLLKHNHPVLAAGLLGTSTAQYCSADITAAFPISLVQNLLKAAQNLKENSTRATVVSLP